MADTTVIQYQKIWLGRHNPFSISILRNGEALDSTITKITIKYKTFFISSDPLTGYPDLFDFSDYVTTGKVDVDLSGLALTVGIDESCEIIVYTESFPDTGIVCEPLLHLEVTDEVLGDETLVDPIAYTWQPALLPVKTVVLDYQVELIDFLRPSIRINAATLKTMTMPVMTADYDGARITFILEGVGGAKITAYTDEETTFGDNSTTEISETEQFSSVVLEYDAALDMFLIVEPWHVTSSGSNASIGEWGAAFEKTLSSGVLTLTGPGYYKVLSESGTSDDLTSIVGLTEGDEIILKLADADEIITVKKGTAIPITSDFILNTTADRLRLQCDGDNKCVELSRASGVFY